MGTADLVPGVSGGTMALVLGIYERLVAALRAATSWSNWVPLVRGDLRGFWRAVHATFLAPVVLGIALAVVGLARLVETALASYPVVLYAAFSGLILAAVVLLVRRVVRWRASDAATLVAALVLTSLLLYGRPVDAGGGTLPLMVAGAIGVSALVLPGISGALILVLVGQYGRVVGAIAELDLVTLAPFAVGALIGIATTARALDWLLRRALSTTMAALVGVMLASLQRVWPWVDADAERLRLLPPPTAWGVEGYVAAALAAVVGYAAVVLLERAAGTRLVAREVEPPA